MNKHEGKEEIIVRNGSARTWKILGWVLPIMLALISAVYALTVQNANARIDNNTVRINTLESEYNQQASQIQNINGNIIRICNKLNIPQCQ